MRAGWWSAVSPAPAAPDVPPEGLHVSGGPQGPTAITAIALALPADAEVSPFVLELAGVSPRASALQACALPADAAAFTAVQNGAWADRPAYDCDLGAVAGTVDGTRVLFDVAPLRQGDVLAFAVVPGATDRASFTKPAVPSIASAPVAPVRDAIGTPAAPARSTSVASVVPPSVAVPALTPAQLAPAVAPVPADVVTASPVAAQSAPTTPEPSVTTEDEQPLRTRIGGALGFALLLAVLLFYSQGRGLLGARVGGP